MLLLTDTSSAVGGTPTALEASYLVIDRPTNTVLAASDPKAPFRAASVVKLLIALDYLHRAGPPDTIPSGDRQLLESMLRTSDDAAASVLWRSGGSAAIVERTATRLGLTGIRPPADPDIWGYTTITAADIARIYRHLLEQADPQTSGFILDALRDAARCATDGRDQYFGIPAAAPRPWAVKQGWSGFGPPDPGTRCDVAPAGPSPPAPWWRPTRPPAPPAHTPKSHERLHVIAGRWATDGHVVGDPSNTTPAATWTPARPAPDLGDPVDAEHAALAAAASTPRTSFCGRERGATTAGKIIQASVVNSVDLQRCVTELGSRVLNPSKRALKITKLRFSRSQSAAGYHSCGRCGRNHHLGVSPLDGRRTPRVGREMRLGGARNRSTRVWVKTGSPAPTSRTWSRPDTHPDELRRRRAHGRHPVSLRSAATKAPSTGDSSSA